MPGQRVVLLSAGSISESFDLIETQALPDGLSLALEYTDRSVVAVFQPAPAVTALLPIDPDTP